MDIKNILTEKVIVETGSKAKQVKTSLLEVGEGVFLSKNKDGRYCLVLKAGKTYVQEGITGFTTMDEIKTETITKGEQYAKEYVATLKHFYANLPTKRDALLARHSMVCDINGWDAASILATSPKPIKETKPEPKPKPEPTTKGEQAPIASKPKEKAETKTESKGKDEKPKSKKALMQERESKALTIFAETLIAQIEQMEKSNWQKPWIAPSMVEPRPIAGKAYHGRNLLMLMFAVMQRGYQYPYFATANMIKSLNFINKADEDEENPRWRTRLKDEDGNDLPWVQINKGEQGYPILLYKPWRIYNKETHEVKPLEDYARLDECEKEDWRIQFMQKLYWVFAIEQTNIKETRPALWERLVAEIEGERVALPSFKHELPAAVDALLEEQQWLCPIKETKGGSRAYYRNSDEDFVEVPDREQFKESESFCGTLFHEMAHSTGGKNHNGRIDAIKEQHGDLKGYAIEELVAEMTAAFTCANYGMSKHINQDSIQYLKSWLDNLKEDPKIIKSVLQYVQVANNKITGTLKHIEKCLDNGWEVTAPIEVGETATADVEY